MEGQSFNVFSIIIIEKDFKGGVCHLEGRREAFQRCWFGKSRSSEKKEMRILEDLFSDFIFFSQGKEN